MTAANRTKPYSNNGGVIELMRNKSARNRYTCTIDYLGNCFYNVAGAKIPEDVFNAMFPLTVNRCIKGNRFVNNSQVI